MANVNVGGKTGSLTGFKPRGKYDWFVGFGENGDQKIAFAMLLYQQGKNGTSSPLDSPGKYLEFYFRAPSKNANTATS